jgi:hypothetical protein
LREDGLVEKHDDMGAPQDPTKGNQPSELDRVADEVVSEAQLQVESLRPEERAYLKEHALKKPMGVLHVWALGVGVVITGEYFGWNQGLSEGGRSACCWPPSSCVPST